MKIIIGILVVALGILLVAKTEWFLQNFGRIDWAEQKLGLDGGSRLAYKLIGLIAIFFGLLLITGLFNGFLGGTVGKLLVR
jgi:hypothetical protein